MPLQSLKSVYVCSHNLICVILFIFLSLAFCTQYEVSLQIFSGYSYMLFKYLMTYKYLIVCIYPHLFDLFPVVGYLGWFGLLSLLEINTFVHKSWLLSDYFSRGELLVWSKGLDTFKTSDTYCQVDQPRNVFQICQKQQVSYLFWNLSKIGPKGSAIPALLEFKFAHLHHFNHFII